MAKKIWFGTRDLMQWVNAPKQSMDSSKKGRANSYSYLNGGAFVRRSWSSHKEFTLAWNLASRDELRVIQDYADGIYGTGFIYWVNPFATDVNVLPQYWASPFLNGLDGPVVAKKDKRPQLTATNENFYQYPVQSAVYTIKPNVVQPSIWVPLPPGCTLWVGVHGAEGTGGKVSITPYATSNEEGNEVQLPFLSANTATRFSTSFDSHTVYEGSPGDAGYGEGAYGDGSYGSGGYGEPGPGTVVDYQGALITFAGSGTMTLSGLIVQILPTGKAPTTGGFLSGQGHSGCVFETQPTLTEYSAAIDKIGLAAKLIETEAWI